PATAGERDSPAGVDGIPEVAVVEGADGVVELRGKLEGPRGRVRASLLGGPGPGDDAGDAVLGGDPREGHLRRRRLWDEESGGRGELRGGTDAGLVVDAGERLADVERLAVPVEVPVVGLGKRRLRGVPPGEQAAGERDAGDDPDAGLLGRREHLVERLEPEGVEDDL